MAQISAKILVGIGSAASIGFGIWHFFVPSAWNWHSYIDARATELVLAVDAINVFFSLSLVLFGLMNASLAMGEGSNRYSKAIVLGATSVLWSTRVVLQLVRPQGTMSALLEYSLLAAFALILICHLIPFVSMLLGKTDAPSAAGSRGPSRASPTETGGGRWDTPIRSRLSR